MIADLGYANQLNYNMVFTSETDKDNWFYNKYYFPNNDNDKGSRNPRYFTFHLALNLLYQLYACPTIIETGCQRELDDIGAGMSTSIFSEYISKFGGNLISVDNNQEHLDRCRRYIKDFNTKNIGLVLLNSIEFLKGYKGDCHLLYLDSLDYPVGEDADNLELRNAAQVHCLNELSTFFFNNAERSNKTIILLDDNQLSGGGKTKLAKQYLIGLKWICLLDAKQSLWINRELFKGVSFE